MATWCCHAAPSSTRISLSGQRATQRVLRLTQESIELSTNRRRCDRNRRQKAAASGRIYSPIACAKAVIATTRRVCNSRLPVGRLPFTRVQRQSDLRNSNIASWSFAASFRKPRVARSASPACRKMASRMVTDAPSCISRVRSRTPTKALYEPCFVSSGSPRENIPSASGGLHVRNVRL